MSSLTPIFSIILSILVYFFFIAPEYAEITTIREDVVTYKTAIERQGEFASTLNGLVNLKRNQNPVSIERLNQLMPEKIDTAHIIADLESMAKNNQMLFGNIQSEVGEVSFSGDSSGDQNVSQQNLEPQTADISFDLIGTYEQFQAFLLELESSLTLLEVTALTFTASDSMFEQFSLTVRAYALPQVIN